MMLTMTDDWRARAMKLGYELADAMKGPNPRRRLFVVKFLLGEADEWLATAPSELQERVAAVLAAQDALDADAWTDAIIAIADWLMAALPDLPGSERLN